MRRYRITVLAILNVVALLMLVGTNRLWDFSAYQSVAPDSLNGSRQLLVVIGESWSSDTARLQAFERDETDQPWRKFGSVISVAVGRNGFAWGRGIHPTGLRGPEIDEGDYRTPAGIFPISSAFGQASPDQLGRIFLPYHQLSRDDFCVDDPKSTYYNRIVSTREITRDWRSAEPMNGPRAGYEAGIVYDQNTAPVAPRRGSCFFIHLGPEAGGTAGCTTMNRVEYYRLLKWLNSGKNPLLVQLPRAVADQVNWGIPE